MIESHSPRSTVPRRRPRVSYLGEEQLGRKSPVHSWRGLEHSAPGVLLQQLRELPGRLLEKESAGHSLKDRADSRGHAMVQGIRFVFFLMRPSTKTEL